MSNLCHNQVLQVEQRRLKEQGILDSSSTAAEKNRLGQFATPLPLALDILKLAHRFIQPYQPVRFLDPAVGTGVFYSALLQVFTGPKDISSAIGFETDQRVADISRKLWTSSGLHIRREDFTRAGQPTTLADKANLIVCNPPYVRHHHLNAEAKRRLRNLIAQRLSLSVSGLAGLYCYFLLLADSWMADGGTALWLVPSEFLDVNYGRELRDYLSTRVTLQRVHRFNPEDVQFLNALVSSCVLVLQKRVPAPDHIVEFTTGGSLLSPHSSVAFPASTLAKAHKWSNASLTAAAHRFLAGNSVRPTLALGDLFDVRRGVATGANDFFILDTSRAKELQLPDEILTPILPGARHITGDRIEADERGWPIVSPRLVLLDCHLPRNIIKETSPALEAYLSSAEKTHLVDRYLLRSRKPWYAQEIRLPAPILCTYMARRKIDRPTFRFFRNLSKAVATNVYLMLYPKPLLKGLVLSQPDAIESIFFALQQLSDAQFFAEGRVYGGGLNKLEPKELGRLMLQVDQPIADQLENLSSARQQHELPIVTMQYPLPEC